MTTLVSSSHGTDASGRKSYARIPEVLEVPNLIQIQNNSFNWLLKEGIKELLDEVTPIQDFTGGRYELRFEDYEFREPKYTEDECRERDKTYAKPIYAKTVLEKKAGDGAGEEVESWVFMGDLPMMTDAGTFIINGAERVVVSQLVRSPGVYFKIEEDPGSGRGLCSAKLIPNRGAWLEFETSTRDVLSVKVDRKRKIPVTTLLRALGLGDDEQLIETFKDVDKNVDHLFIPTTMEKEPAVRTEDEALLDFYRKLRPGEPPSLDNARALLNTLFFNFRRYDLGRVGRYKVNNRLGLGGASRNGKAKGADSVDPSPAERVLSAEDLVAIVKRMIMINNGEDRDDDIDHLGNRRVRAVGELTQNQLRIGLLRMERVVKERMTLIDPEQATPSALINIRPIVAAIKEFFGGLAAVAVHGPDEPAGRAHAQAPPLGAGPRRPLPRAGRLRRPRRAPQPLRPYLPHRDAGRPQHRTPRLSGDLRARQQVRLHRDAVPASPEGSPQPARGARGPDRP